MERNNIQEDAEKTCFIPNTFSGTAKKLRLTYTTFTKHTGNTALNFATQSTRKLNNTAMLKAERRKAEAIKIIRHNVFC